MAHGQTNTNTQPCPVIMAGGIGGGNTSQYYLESDGKDDYKPDMTKPEYRVPSMAEIRAIPWNGFNVVSTFAGCGGSSTGYRMAGFRILWASEFIDAARDTYAANKDPKTVLDGRDIRGVTPEEILSAIKLKRGELDVLDGSPPCASFSTAGKREAGWGKVKAYSDKAQRTDDLFFEFTRILDGLQPKVFVAENVSGLVKGTAKGYFLEILAALKGCGYRVSCRVLDAQWLGVPQMRQRTIFVGVREDLGIEPTHPAPLPYRYSVRDAIGVAFRPKSYAANGWIDGDEPAAAIQASGQYFVEEANGHKSAGLGKGHAWRDVTDIPAPTVQAQRPKPVAVLEPETDISRFAIGAEWDTLRHGEGSSRYINLRKASLDAASPCVTAAGGNSSTASVTHPTEKRKFTIAELKRICAFPDDFILTGTYAQQWERCGRAVPPVMMSHIASTVRDKILRRIQ